MYDATGRVKSSVYFVRFIENRKPHKIYKNEPRFKNYMK